MNKSENPPKALYRSNRQRMIAGVCGGFAEYFEIDVAVVRVLWLLTLLFHGFGVLAYLLCAVIIKKNPEPSTPINGTDQKENAFRPPAAQSGSAIGWVVVIILLVFILLFGVRIFHHPFPPFRPHVGWDWNMNRFEDLLSFLLILVGVIFVAGRMRAKTDSENKSGRFLRSRSKRIIGGICGGLSDLWQIDVAWIRLGLVVLSLASNLLVGIIIYLILLIAIPEEPQKNTV